jgi:glycosyltransferase involved in cell wall biosynthesis
MTVLFLYTELADYFLKCCNELAKSANVHIVRWPVNKEAPFEFEYSANLKIYDKKAYSLQELQKLVAGINPNIIICSGWIDRDYLKTVKSYFRKIPTVLACDTHWNGSLKQYLAMVLSRFFLLNTFSHSWVPGNPQYRYVKKLGFKEKNIHRGFYCCDLSKFNRLYENQSLNKQNKFPRRFIYTGRYYEFKGVQDLWKAFIQAQTEEANDWELWCLGTGDIEPVIHHGIRHFGFVQPKDLDPILAECGVFVLPSHFEPWGVVVQEYAAAGFPLILSTAVGARETFQQEGENGFSFMTGNPDALKEALKKVMKLSDKELFLMAGKSHELAGRITPQQWASTVLEIGNENKKK